MFKLTRFLGIDGNSTSTAEKLVATLGGFTGIFLVSYISFQFTGTSGAALIVPSMGASAVLLFAVPHGKLSQPWALVGGHVVSAFVGMTCYLLIPDVFLAAGLATGLAIGAMHVTRCIHPPGGATALAAVIGGDAIHSLGYQYVLTPILLNTLIILVTAIVFNSIFPWRRYPASMMHFTDAPIHAEKSFSRQIDKKHIEKAIADMDMVVDITTEDLQQLLELSLHHADSPKLPSKQILLGHFYTNGKHGGEWSVRQIIDESGSSEPDKDMVIYKVVEGHGLRNADSCSREEFARWANREVFPNKDLSTPG